MANSKRTILSMAPLFLSMSLMFLGNGLIIPSAGVELKNAGADELIIGLINTCFFIGAMISTILAHRIVSKVGHIRSFAIFTAVFGVSAMLHALSLNLYFWAILRALLGFCYYALLMVIESWLNAKISNSVRSRVIAFYEAVFYVSFGAGILILALNLASFEVFIISAAFIMLSSIPLNLIKIKEPLVPQKERISIPKIFSIVPLALAGSVTAGVLVNGFFSMSSVFILLQGYGAKEASFFMTIAMAGGFCAQLFIGKFSDRFGRRPAIILSCVTALIAASAFLLLKNANFALWCALAFILGSGIFCLYGLSIARANDEINEKSQSAKVARTLLFSYSLGSIVSPLLTGGAMKIFGVGGFIYVYIFLLVFLLAFALSKKTIAAQFRKSYEPLTVRAHLDGELKTGGGDGDFK